jgi:hypothetical protein
MVQMYGCNKKLGSMLGLTDNLGKKFKCRTGCEEPIAARNHFATASLPNPVGLPTLSRETNVRSGWLNSKTSRI